MTVNHFAACVLTTLGIVASSFTILADPAPSPKENLQREFAITTDDGKASFWFSVRNKRPDRVSGSIFNSGHGLEVITPDGLLVHMSATTLKTRLAQPLEPGEARQWELPIEEVFKQQDCDLAGSYLVRWKFRERGSNVIRIRRKSDAPAIVRSGRARSGTPKSIMDEFYRACDEGRLFSRWLQVSEKDEAEREVADLLIRSYLATSKLRDGVKRLFGKEFDGEWLLHDTQSAIDQLNAAELRLADDFKTCWIDFEDWSAEFVLDDSGGWQLRASNFLTAEKKPHPTVRVNTVALESTVNDMYADRFKSFEELERVLRERRENFPKRRSQDH